MKMLTHASRWALSALLLGTATGAAWADFKDLPFKARVETTEVMGVDPARCPSTSFLGTTAGTGTASHMGKVRLAAVDCPSTLDGMNWSFNLGELSLTAANGDILRARYQGRLSPIPGSDPVIHAISGQFAVTGGTGRFSGARGGGSLQGTENLATLQGVFEVDGRLSLVKDKD